MDRTKELTLELPDGRVSKFPPRDGCLLILDTLIADLNRDGWSVIVEAASGELVNALAGLTRTLGFPDPPLILRRSVDQAVACLGDDPCWRERYERVAVEFREPNGAEVQTLVVTDPQKGCHAPIRGCSTWGTAGDSHCLLWATLKRWRDAVAAIPAEPLVGTGELGATDDGKESNLRVAQQPINIYNPENVFMNAGDVFNKIDRSPIANRSTVDGSFNDVRQDLSPQVVSALTRLTESVISSRNEAARNLLEELKAELGKQRPERSRLETIGGAIVKAIPTISALASLVKTITSSLP